MVQVAPADVMNLSLGGPVDYPDIAEAVAAAQAQGVTLVAAAGNDGTTADMYPAAYPTVLSVGALGPDGQRTCYSNYAPSVDVWAPGGGAVDVAPGIDDCPIAGSDEDPFEGWVPSTVKDYTTDELGWAYNQGTSMASPHVAGLAALILSENPGVPPATVRQRIIDYALPTSAGPRVNARNSLTMTQAPTSALWAVLVDAATGAEVSRVQAGSSNDYSFDDLPAGEFHVFAGTDEDGDGRVGVPAPIPFARAWGAAGGAVSPSATPIAGSESASVSFDVGLPVEQEPNDGTAAPNALVVGGYTFGQLPAGDVDVYRVIVPAQGTYRFETVGVTGACGIVFEENTTLRLLDSDGVELAANDDIDANSNDYCSRISISLTAGTYFLEVGSAVGGQGRQYAVMAQRGS